MTTVSQRPASETVSGAPSVDEGGGRPWAIVAQREIVVRLTNRAFLVSTLITLLFIAGFGAFSVWDSNRTTTYTVAVTGADGRQLVERAAASARQADDKVSIESTPVSGEPAARALVDDGTADSWLHQTGSGWTLTSADDADLALRTAVEAALRDSVLERNAAAAGTTVQALEQGGPSLDVDGMDAGDTAHPAGVAGQDEPVSCHREGAQVIRGAGRDDASAGQHDEALAEAFDEVELVGGEEDRDAARGVLAQQVGHVVDGCRVEAAERLVEHEGARLPHQGGDDLHPLLVAERELLDVVLGPVGEAEPLEVARHLGSRRNGAESPEPAEVDELVQHRLLGVEAALLGHVAEVPAVELGDRPVVPEHLAARGGQDPHDHAHRRRLARTVPADETREPPGRHGEADVVDGPDLAEGARQPSHLEVGRRTWSGESVPVVAHGATVGVHRWPKDQSREGSSASPGRMSPAS